MQELLGHLFNVIGPVFLCAACGFALVKAKMPFDTSSAFHESEGAFVIRNRSRINMLEHILVVKTAMF
ncbi:hypothetical protein GR183_09090 [Stappia sp. GBMRC 2046]|uniref:Uncharacterized protein n=1 Tax=Stappia sediminis TaxID=2692190 RepID=A0A7X3LTX3_9HYPH|nr:hypothetical protein [Stappia sediminis]MXN65060.1 hypothetical protein [Stappia sediminis]